MQALSGLTGDDNECGNVSFRKPMRKERDFRAKAQRIEPRMPRYDGNGRYSPESASLVGATILRIGTTDEPNVDGGGLWSEWDKEGLSGLLVLGFSEIGMWVENG